MEKLLSQWSLHDKYGQSKTKNWRWLALICSAEFYKEKHKTVGGVCENFPFIEVSYDLEMLGWEKCIKSFLLEMLKHQFLIKLIMRGALNGSGYCIASARLYCSDSILFENDALESWLWIAYLQWGLTKNLYIINKLLRVKKGCNLYIIPIPFAALLVLLFVCLLHDSFLSS